MKFTGVEEVKNLHHDEGIKHESKMAGIDSVLIKDREIVIWARWVIEAAGSDGASNLTVMPFHLGGVLKHTSVVGIRIFRNPVLTCKHKEEHYH